jgi:hypothetical protein
MSVKGHALRAERKPQPADRVLPDGAADSGLQRDHKEIAVSKNWPRSSSVTTGYFVKARNRHLIPFTRSYTSGELSTGICPYCSP